MIFEWNTKKADLNFKKHSVLFENAIEAFDDKNAVLAIDESHSIAELRMNLIGVTKQGLLFVVFTEPDDETIRIISARKATKFEENIYVGK